MDLLKAAASQSPAIDVSYIISSEYRQKAEQYNHPYGWKLVKASCSVTCGSRGKKYCIKTEYLNEAKSASSRCKKRVLTVDRNIEVQNICNIILLKFVVVTVATLL